MNPAPDQNPAEQLGPYDLYERLGLGGMATVYRAKKRGPAGYERSVALKRMLSHLAEDASFVDSFIREAKVASLLVHPNIAQVYDFGRISGVYYIAMELVSGFDLRKLLRYASKSNEPIPLHVVLSILGELADALEYAHSFVDEQGARLNIVHRDISPSNMIVSHTGHVKVIDFGIAKASSRQLHTESGQVKGKLGYMSPEAALGMEIGPVSDVFSMGVVAWELVTASPLFSAKTDFETMWRIREAEIPPPSRHNPASPPELDQIILAALVRNPDRRLASARAFRRALDAIAARAQLQVSARAVAEWLGQFAQPGDGARASSSGRTPPPEVVTSVTKPSGRQQLKRSNADIKLATEIWGEDAHTVEKGPDFSNVDGPLAPSPQVTAFATPGAMASQAMVTIMPPAPPMVTPTRTNPRTVALVLCAVLTVIAGSLAGVLYSKSKRAPVAAREDARERRVAQQDPVALAPSSVAPTPRVAIAPDANVAATPRVAIAPDVNVAPTPPDANVAATPRVAIAPVSDVDVSDAPADRPPAKVTTTKPTHDHRPATKTHIKDHEVAPSPDRTPDPVPPPRVDLLPPPPPPPDLIAHPVTPVEPPKPPARTPVVPATAVTKLSGDVPTIKGDTDADVQIKMCIDEQGHVSSAKIVKTTAQLPSDLQGVLQSWRYKPYLNKDGKPSPACFLLPVRIVVKRSD